MDLFLQEIDQTKAAFNLEKLLNFQLSHDAQIVRDVDYLYQCLINQKAYGTALAPLAALVFGVDEYLKVKPYSKTPSHPNAKTLSRLQRTSVTSIS